MREVPGQEIQIEIGWERDQEMRKYRERLEQEKGERQQEGEG